MGKLSMTRRKLPMVHLLIAIFALSVSSVSGVFAQSDEERVRFSPPDASVFPMIKFSLIALDSDRQRITDLSDLRLTEDGEDIGEFFSETVETGAEVIFVIDANTDIEERDEDGGLSRREKVRESILRFVDLYMDADYVDRVSVIVPDEQSGRFLEEPGITFHNSVKNAVNFYLPSELGETPLSNMMEMAIQQAKQGSDEGRSAAIVLFSDSSRINEQLDFEDIVDQALLNEAVIYGAILGDTAETWEIDDMQKLTNPTGGLQLHMPEPEDADPLYDLIRDRAVTTLVTYRSSLNSSGEHTIGAAVDGGTGEVVFDLVVAPPGVALAIDNSQPIVRVAPEALTPLEEVDPKIQPLAANLSWPDGHPRELSSVTLLIDGEPRSPRIPVLDATGLLTFDWDIREFDSGLYAIQVQVEDELGLSAISEPVPLVIAVNRPVFQPTATPAPTPTPIPTPVPVPTPTPEPVPLIDLARDNALFLGTGAGAVLLVVLAIVVIALIIRSRRKMRKAKEAPQQTGLSPYDTSGGGAPASGSAYAVAPETGSPMTGAYLEALENAPDHSTLIPISRNNVALGRDPKLVQVRFNDPSVSGLHARILESHRSYRIYDEGSTSGTYVNFQRIGLTPRVLVNRDEIHLGSVHLRFHLVTPSSEATSPQNQDEASETLSKNRDDDTIAK